MPRLGGNDGHVDEPLLRMVTQGRGLSTSGQLGTSPAVECLAVDVIDRWAGAFEFSLTADGNAEAEGIIYYFAPDGRWHHAGEGGGSFGGWDVPWVPRIDGWDGRPFLSLGCYGSEFEDDDENDVLVLVHLGFVRPGVTNVEVSDSRGQRSRPVDSAVGAYAVLALGDGKTTFRYRDSAGRVLAESDYVP